MFTNLSSFTDILDDLDEIANSQPISWPSNDSREIQPEVSHDTAVKTAVVDNDNTRTKSARPMKHTGQCGEFRSVEEIDEKYRSVFSYPYFNLVQSRVIDDALYSDKSMAICAPTGSGKTVVFEMAIVQLLMELDDKQYNDDFKIIYMAPVKALCTERLTEWYPKFTKLGLLCIEVTGDTDVDFSQLKPYRIIITTPEKWDMLTRRWRDHRGLVEDIKLFLIDEVHILNDSVRGPVLEAVVSRMKTIESSAQSAHRIEQLQKQYQDISEPSTVRAVQNCPKSSPPRIRFVAVSATVNNPEDVAAWLGTADKPAVCYRFGDECRPVKLKRVVEGYPCPPGTSMFKFDITLNYKLWPIIQKHHNGKPTLIFCNTRKSVSLTADVLSRELTISFTPEQRAKLTALASSIKTKKLQSLLLSGVGCHHAGLLFEERVNIERAFRNRDLPILITTTTLAMGVNLPAHLVIVKNTKQYANGVYQEYSISTVLQMVGRAGRPQFDTEATAVIMTTTADKPRYQALVGGSEPLQSYLHKRLPENLNSEAALGTVTDVAQCVQWLRSTFLCVRAARDPKWYLGLPPNAPTSLITKKIEELCVIAMNGLATSGLITMDEASCIESTEAGRLMSIYYLDLETMKHIMKIEGTESLERLLWIVCESHELADMHLRIDERRCLNALNRNNAATTIRFPMKGKINSRQMKLNCVIQAILGCLPIPDPSLNQEAMKIMRIAQRVCKCLVAYVTRPLLISKQPQFYSAVLNSLLLAKCVAAHLWENSPYVSKQLRGIGPTYSTLLATSGKVNFTLLDESHPRDLERIMNKGAPAGNVLRKQVGLLPKYQLTMHPIDEKKVSVQLMLLNQAHLAENLEQLTAGENHRCHVVVGDSENHLLLLTSFTDKNLIGVYDGTLTYEITRKHSFEHKLMVHCISSDFVGIDAECEYHFKDLEPQYSRGDSYMTNATVGKTPKMTTKKQTSITDVYKERKRKSNDNDITQSKEKKKRDNALINEIKHLKASFGMTSIALKKDVDQSAAMSNKVLLEMTQLANNKANYSNNTTDYSEKQDEKSRLVNSEIVKDYEYPEIVIDDIDEDALMVDDHIDDILNNIENEISRNRDHELPEVDMLPSTSSATRNAVGRNQSTQVHSSFFVEPSKSNVETKTIHMNNNMNNIKLQSYKSLNNSRKRRASNAKSNYSFIESIANTIDLTDDEVAPKSDTGFSETIKRHVDQFLKNVHKDTDTPGIVLEEFIDNTQEIPIVIPNKQIASRENKLLDDSFVLINDNEVINTKHTEMDDVEETKDEDIQVEDFDKLLKEIEALSDPTKHIIVNMPKNHQYETISNDDVIPTQTIKELKSMNGEESRRNNERTEPKYQDYLSETDELICTSKEDIINISRKENIASTYDSVETAKYSVVDKTKQETVLKDDLLSVHETSTLQDSSKTIDPCMRKAIGPFKDSNTALLKVLNGNNNNIDLLYKSLIPKDVDDVNDNILRLNRTLNMNYTYCPEIKTRQILSIEENVSNKPLTATPYDLDTMLSKDTTFNKNIVCIENANANQNLTQRKVNEGEGMELSCLSENRLKPTTENITTRSDLQNPSSQSPKFECLALNGDSSLDSTNNNTRLNIHKRVNSNKNTKYLAIMGTARAPTVSRRIPANSEESSTSSFTQKADKLSHQVNSRNDGYINKYSFTTTKIDVSTKNTPEHQVRIIRKLKMDVDVTEMVSKRTNISDYEQKPGRNNTNCDGNEYLDDRISLSSGHDNTEIIDNPRQDNMQKLLKNDNSIEYTEIAFTEQAKMHNTIRLTEHSNITRLPMTYPRPNLVIEKLSGNDNSESKARTATVDTNDRRGIINKMEEEYKVPKETPTKLYENVRDILGKYRTILRKNNRNNNVDTASEETTVKADTKLIGNERKPLRGKWKRPYNIRDINNVDIALPKSLIVEATSSPKPTPTSDEVLTRFKAINYNDQNLKDFKPIPDLKITHRTYSDDQQRHYIDEGHIDSQEYSPDQIFPMKTLDLPVNEIAQVMFNPKTLLQCYTDESDELIPPPEEFCDESAYSPMITNDDFNIEGLPTQEDYLSNVQVDNEELDTKELDTSIFDDYSHHTLTQSKEIETWTLSQDESSEPNYSFHPNPLKSYTVVRNNIPTNINTQRASNNFRRSKLDNFKFTPKNKLRM